MRIRRGRIVRVPLAVLAGATALVAAHGVAPRPRAEACGACVCADTQAPHLVYPTPGGEVPVDARVFVRGPGVSAETVALRDAMSGEMVMAAVGAAGPAESDGLWIVPDAHLAPRTAYRVEIDGEPIGSFQTGTSPDAMAPVIEEVQVDPDGGALRAVCDAKTGIALRVVPVGDEHYEALVQLDVLGPDGSSARVIEVASFHEVSFGRWDGDPEHWGGNCLGAADVPWLRGEAPLDVEVTLYDRAGNASAPVRIEDVTPIRVAAPGCGDDGSAAGCSVVHYRP